MGHHSLSQRLRLQWRLKLDTLMIDTALEMFNRLEDDRNIYTDSREVEVMQRTFQANQVAAVHGGR